MKRFQKAAAKRAVTFLLASALTTGLFAAHAPAELLAGEEAAVEVVAPETMAEVTAEEVPSEEVSLEEVSSEEVSSEEVSSEEVSSEEVIEVIATEPVSDPTEPSVPLIEEPAAEESTAAPTETTVTETAADPTEPSEAETIADPTEPSEAETIADPTEPTEAGSVIEPTEGLSEPKTEATEATGATTEAVLDENSNDTPEEAAIADIMQLLEETGGLTQEELKSIREDLEGLTMEELNAKLGEAQQSYNDKQTSATEAASDFDTAKDAYDAKYNELKDLLNSLNGADGSDFAMKLEEFNALVQNYQNEMANTEALRAEYDRLTAEYNSSKAEYDAAVESYSAAQENYRAKAEAYNALLAQEGADKADIEAAYTELLGLEGQLELDFSAVKGFEKALTLDYDEIQVMFKGGLGGINEISALLDAKQAELLLLLEGKEGVDLDKVKELIDAANSSLEDAKALRDDFIAAMEEENEAIREYNDVIDAQNELIRQENEAIEQRNKEAQDVYDAWLESDANEEWDGFWDGIFNEGDTTDAEKDLMKEYLLAELEKLGMDLDDFIDPETGEYVVSEELIAALNNAAVKIEEDAQAYEAAKEAYNELQDKVLSIQNSLKDAKNPTAEQMQAWYNELSALYDTAKLDLLSNGVLISESLGGQLGMLCEELIAALQAENWEKYLDLLRESENLIGNYQDRNSGIAAGDMNLSLDQFTKTQDGKKLNYGYLRKGTGKNDAKYGDTKDEFFMNINDPNNLPKGQIPVYQTEKDFNDSKATGYIEVVEKGKSEPFSYESDGKRYEYNGGSRIVTDLKTGEVLEDSTLDIKSGSYGVSNNGPNKDAIDSYFYDYSFILYNDNHEPIGRMVTYYVVKGDQLFDTMNAEDYITLNKGGNAGLGRAMYLELEPGYSATLAYCACGEKGHSAVFSNNNPTEKQSWQMPFHYHDNNLPNTRGDGAKQKTGITFGSFNNSVAYDVLTDFEPEDFGQYDDIPEEEYMILKQENLQDYLDKLSEVSADDFTPPEGLTYEELKEWIMINVPDGPAIVDRWEEINYEEPPAEPTTESTTESTTEEETSESTTEPSSEEETLEPTTEPSSEEVTTEPSTEPTSGSEETTEPSSEEEPTEPETNPEEDTTEPETDPEEEEEPPTNEDSEIVEIPPQNPEVPEERVVLEFPPETPVEADTFTELETVTPQVWRQVDNTWTANDLVPNDDGSFMEVNEDTPLGTWTQTPEGEWEFIPMETPLADMPKTGETPWTVIIPMIGLLLIALGVVYYINGRKSSVKK